MAPLHLHSCFVRARRLNVIIQPHLRFVYELMRWDEHLQLKRSGGGAKAEDAGGGGGGLKREAEWQAICREIARMNRPYARS